MSAPSDKARRLIVNLEENASSTGGYYNRKALLDYIVKLEDVADAAREFEWFQLFTGGHPDDRELSLAIPVGDARRLMRALRALDGDA